MNYRSFLHRNTPHPENIYTHTNLQPLNGHSHFGKGLLEVTQKPLRRKNWIFVALSSTHCVSTAMPTAIFGELLEIFVSQAQTRCPYKRGPLLWQLAKGFCVGDILTGRIVFGNFGIHANSDDFPWKTHRNTSEFAQTADTPKLWWISVGFSKESRQISHEFPKFPNSFNTKNGLKDPKKGSEKRSTTWPNNFKPLSGRLKFLTGTSVKVFHRPNFAQKKLFFTARICRGGPTNISWRIGGNEMHLVSPDSFMQWKCRQRSVLGFKMAIYGSNDTLVMFSVLSLRILQLIFGYNWLIRPVQG